MKYLSLLLIVVLFLTSCEDDFLDRTPRDSVSTENFFKTEADLALYANGLVSMPSGFDFYLADQSSDNAATTGAVEIKTIMTGSPSSQTITGGWGWGRLRDINFFLENYDNNELTEDIQNHYAALARFYRADFYYGKVKRYSDVPWYDEVLSTNDEEELYKTQDSRTFVVDRIMEDLDFATDNMRENVPVGTPDKWVAMLLKARIALHEGTYRKYHPELELQSTADVYLTIAQDAAKAIMDSGRYSLYTTGNTTDDYHNMFVSGSLAGNPEMIYYNIYDYAKGRTAGHRYEMQDYELSPSRDLVQAYLMNDGSRYTDQQDYKTNLYVTEFEDRDPRMSQTLAYPGWINYASGLATPYVQELNKNFSGYHLIKGYVNTTDQSVEEEVDIPVMRYAEALLTFAEAKAELGVLTQADLDMSINLLRERVGMPAMLLADANANPDPFLMAKYPDVSGANTGVILEVRRERRVELAFEGRRYDDLMRWYGGALLEKEPMGMYFPGLGKYDMTGDGVEDIILISKSESIPEGDAKEVNSLGAKLIYYRVGMIGEDATVYLVNGENGGETETEVLNRVFTAPRDYYRPIPFSQTVLNPNLVQPFGWE